LTALRAWLGSQACPLASEPTQGDEVDALTPEISDALRRGAQRLAACVSDVVQLVKFE
jgi:hypothetical protein